jgi:hypothetical protein
MMPGPKSAREKEYSELLGFGLCSSSGILENRKHDVSDSGSVSVLR